MTNESKRRHYEDIELGLLGESPTLLVEADAMVEFAERYDPQYFHARAAQAADSRFGELIASGIYTMALWRQLDHQIAPDIAWICGVAWDDVRWPVAVRAGDTLRARSSVVEKRASAKDASRGIVRCHYQLLNQRDETVFACISTNLIERR